MDYIVYPDKKGYKSNYSLIDELNPSCVIPYLKIIFLEIPKFNEKTLQNEEHEWMNFFRNYSEKPKDLKNKVLEKAYQKIAFLYFSKNERELYNQLEKRYADELESQRTSFNDGFNNGKKVGIEEGIQKGIKETAIKMIQKGMSLNIISEITSLTVDQIKELNK